MFERLKEIARKLGDYCILAFNILAMIICTPLLLCWWYFVKPPELRFCGGHKPQFQKPSRICRESMRRAEPQHRLRPRALTITLELPYHSQRTFEQAQSPFLTRLPLELRQRIYKLALGGLSIHLSVVYDAQAVYWLRAVRCWQGRCCHRQFYDGSDTPCKEPLCTDLATPLLRTCRRM
jgi:hypothetical protein